MNHYVPDFEMVDDDYVLPSSSTRSKKSSLVEDDIVELVWENGQVVTQSQNSHRSLLLKKAAPPSPVYNHQSTVRNIPQPQQQQHLFMQEDEMASWLHYPLNDTNFDDLCAALLYPPAAAPSSCTTTTPPAAMRPPVPLQRRAEAVANFPLFSRQQGRAGEASPRSFTAAVVRESKVVDSSVSPSEAAANSNTTTNRETAPTSSPGGSSNSAEPPPPPPSDHDRKRKGVDEDLDYQSEDTEFESANPKKQQARGSSSTKRSRAAEVHNLSERRRRDRINEKMRALQELIPRCNKSDKASMLDEAIEYLKSLQLQVQMMSMGCGMMPMMFPGVQQYMSPIGMGLGFGLGMEMGMNRPMMPFPNVLAGASMPMPAAAAAHLGPRFPVPAFHMPPVPTDPNRMQGAGPRYPMLNSTGVSNSNQIRVPNFADPDQQYLSLHQIQLPVVQNQATVHPNNGGKPSTTQGTDNLDNNQSGL